MAKTEAERAKEYRARKKAQDAGNETQAGAVIPAEVTERPTVEDAEAAYLAGDADGERIAAAIMKRYNKSQCWAFIMYEDSAPPDYEDRLRLLGVQFALSPWHDKDLDKNRKQKKNHRHGLLYWPGGATTYKTAAAITRDVLHGTIPIPVVSPRGYYRYFCHLDNPKKAQYDQADIINGNGFDIGNFLDLTAQEENELCRKLIEIIEAQNITEYWDLLTWTMYNEKSFVFEFVRKNTLFLNSAVSSRRNKLKEARLEFERQSTRR